MSVAQTCRITTLLSQTLTVVKPPGRPLKMAAELHPRSGKLIGLSNSNRTARRNQPVQEFNHGLVLSKEPLRDRDVFTVRIDKKVNNCRPRLLSLSPIRQRECANRAAGPGRVCPTVRREGQRTSITVHRCSDTCNGSLSS